MYRNIGKKIKVLAKVIAWLNAVVSVAVGLFIIIIAIQNQDGTPEILFGGLVAVFGLLFSWLGSFVLYGFGQLVDNSDKLVEEIISRDNYEI